MKSKLLCFCALFFSFNAYAQNNQVSKKKYSDQQFNKQDTAIGYTEAVLVDNVLYISGAVGKGSIAEQLKGIYTDLGNILKAYGCTFRNVVKETLYTTEMDEVKKNNDIRKAFYNNDFPAATWVQVSRLFSSRKDAQIEVELIAHLPVRWKRK